MKSASKHITITGIVTGVFAHRFVVEGEAGKYLADLGPGGLHAVTLTEGTEVTISGERKPSEIKVWAVTIGDGEPIQIHHPHKPPHDRPHHHGHNHHDDHHEPANPAIAINAVREAGYAVLSAPRRKPKHFEVLGRSEDGHHVEFHVELDGHIRKSKPSDPDEPKWHEHGYGRHEHEHHRDATPDAALKAVRDIGCVVTHHARRKPKHFEILGRDAQGHYREFHVELDGHIRKSKSASPDDPKWTAE